MTIATKRKVDLTALAEDFLRQLEVGKAAYAQARQTFAEILNHCGAGDQIPLKDKTTSLEIVDQFADRNIVWKPAGVERFTGRVRRATNLTAKL
jgi:hypothetical protein